MCKRQFKTYCIFHFFTLFLIYFYHVSISVGDSGAIVGSDLPGCTVIGNENSIGHYAVVGVRCQDLKYKVYERSFDVI